MEEESSCCTLIIFHGFLAITISCYREKTTENNYEQKTATPLLKRLIKLGSFYCTLVTEKL